MTMPSSPSPTRFENRKRFRLPDVVTVLDTCVKLVPSAALFSALFALDDNLRWIGLLGVVPLFFAFQKGCPSCSLRHTRGTTDAWPTWPGH
jgi:hypothetical protein